MLHSEAKEYNFLKRLFIIALSEVLFHQLLMISSAAKNHQTLTITITFFDWEIGILSSLKPLLSQGDIITIHEVILKYR